MQLRVMQLVVGSSLARSLAVCRMPPSAPPTFLSLQLVMI